MDTIREQTEWEKKLSQLLWEFMEEKKKNPEWFLEISTTLMTGSKVMDVYMISKQFWFIEWLVDNDKIDLMKLKKWIEDNKFYCAKWGKITNMLLMLLSIQDNPIEFLISILK